ncbi:MAG: ankyrin repeat domain-containing protein, partial [Clostridiaceae bacterium]|nr:ankyrin repeat domain-containing protein [Clostridiaceae bacterium]
EVVEVLIAAGVDLEKADNLSCTPLFWAVQNSNAEIVKALLAAGANINKPNKWGTTPLQYARSKGSENIVRLLIQHSMPKKAKYNTKIKLKKGNKRKRNIILISIFAVTLIGLLLLLNTPSFKARHVAGTFMGQMKAGHVSDTLFADSCDLSDVKIYYDSWENYVSIEKYKFKNITNISSGEIKEYKVVFEATVSFKSHARLFGDEVGNPSTLYDYYDITFSIYLIEDVDNLSTYDYMIYKVYS